MKILLIGSDSKYAIEIPYLKHLIESKEVSTVDLFSAQRRFLDYYNANIFNKILYRVGVANILSKINKEILAEVKKTKPDIVFVFKGMEILPETLLFLKEQGIKLVNYNPDNPFIFSGRGSGNKNITNSIGLYDLHFTYNLEIKKQLEDQYKAKTVLLPFGFDISDNLFETCKKEKEIIKVCFLGNPDKKRATFIEELAKNGVAIDVFGNDWNKFVNHTNITTHKPVYNEDQWKTLRKYRVQINLMRIHNEDSHNMRTFEVAGIGGIQVAPYTKEHNLFFEDGNEIFLYKNLQDCVDKINYLLALSKEEAIELRVASRNAAVNKKHSYKDRAIQVLEVLKEFK